MILILLHPLSLAAFGASIMTGYLLTREDEIKKIATITWIVAMQSAIIMIACGAHRKVNVSCFSNEDMFPLDRVFIATAIGVVLSIAISKTSNRNDNPKAMTVTGIIAMMLVIAAGMQYRIPNSGSSGGTSCFSNGFR